MHCKTKLYSGEHLPVYSHLHKSVFIQLVSVELP